MLMYALVGYGKMGRAIESAAQMRGHRLVATVRRGDAIDAPTVGSAAVAFEFTAPGEAEANVTALVREGVAVVCGTTGWEPSGELLRAIESSERGVVLAPNFSMGVQLFFRLVGEARRLARSLGGYDPWIHEAHHRHKRDAPSGTAVRLGELFFDEQFRGQIVSTRAGGEPGRHTVGLDGAADAITLEHRARGREGFAAGAVLAAEWVVERHGLHTFDDIAEEILK